MDTVTYRDKAVTDELDKGYKRLVIDISKHREVAMLFGVAAVPEAVIMKPDGGIQSRISGYIPPLEYAQWLKSEGNDERIRE